MTNRKRPHKEEGKNRVVLIFIGLVLILGAVVIAVDRDKLPAQIRDHKITAAIYEKRDALSGFETEPPVADKSHGYKGNERSELERLISKGAQDD